MPQLPAVPATARLVLFALLGVDWRELRACDNEAPTIRDDCS